MSTKQQKAVPSVVLWRERLLPLLASTGLGVVFNAWGSSSELAEDLLNSPAEEADARTHVWQEQKLNELNYVTLAVRLSLH